VSAAAIPSGLNVGTSTYRATVIRYMFNPYTNLSNTKTGLDSNVTSVEVGSVNS